MTTKSLADSLQAEFSTRLDSALILAIAAEVQDGDHDSEASARATLQALADAAAAESAIDTSNPNFGQQQPHDTTNVPDALSESATTETTTSLATSDEDAIERAFQAWTLEDSQRHADDEKEIRSVFPLPGSSPDVSQDPISFLKSLFPKRERIEIQLAYDDAGEDIEDAIETLLTEDLLLQEEEDYLRSPEHSEAETSTVGKKRRQRHRKPGKQTVSLTSTPRGISTNGSSNGTHGSFARPEKANVWVQTDSSVLYLSQLLSIPAGSLSSLFYSNDNSLPLAVNKVLDQAELYHEAIESEDNKLAELRELFPDGPMEALRRCLYGTEGDIPRSVELFKVLQDIHQREGTPLAHGLLLGQRPRTKATALAPAPVAQRLADALPEPVTGTSSSSRGQRPPTAQECLLLAATVRSKRDDAYRSAARTWRNKNALGNSGVAAYWADHARKLDREAREWEMRAARATVGERQTQARSIQSIDLHGLTASQALTVTNETLIKWWHNPSSPASLTIVTGAGKHSAGQAPILLPAVRKLLEREGYDWKYEGDRYNRGSVIVTGLQGRKKVSGW